MPLPPNRPSTLEAAHHPTFVLLRLLLFGAGVGAQELGEGPVPGQQLLVGAHLGDLATTHDDDDIHLWQVADPMRDQEPSLRAKWRPGGSAHMCDRESPRA